MKKQPTAASKIAKFYRSYSVRTFKQKEIIIRASEEPKGVYFIKAGKIRQYTIDQKGNEVTVNIFHKNALFPLSWAVNQTENEYFFDALVDSELRKAPRDDFLALLYRDPHLMFSLLSTIYRRLDNTYMRIVHLMSSSAYVRILHLLYVQALKKKVGQDDQSIELRIKGYDLAAYCGVTKETMSREFKKLKLKRIAKFTNNGIHIYSTNRLKTELDKHN